jgi:hypothetical protein
VLDHIADEHASSVVRELTAEHIVHCGRSLADAQKVEYLQPGSIVLGTHAGSWSQQPHVRRVLEESVADLHPTHAAEKRDHGFAVLRRITATVEHGGDGRCLSLRTEEVHPLELFSSFRIESVGEHPFHHNYGEFAVPADAEAQAQARAQAQAQAQAQSQSRELFSKIATPDSPITHCTNDKFAPFTKYSFVGGMQGLTSPKFILGSDIKLSSTSAKTLTMNDDAFDGFAAVSATNGGCVEFSTNLAGGFNFNWDWVNNAAVKPSIELLPGVVCTDCYAFLGAGFMVIIQYTSGTSATVSCQAKIKGGAGFNAKIDVKDPNMVQQALTKDLAPPAKDFGFGIPLSNSGLTFFYKFGESEHHPN